MRKFIAVLMALTFAFTSTMTLASKQVDKVELPETIGIIVQMPDGSVQVIPLPKVTEEMLNQADVDSLPTSNVVNSNDEVTKAVLYIPPVFFWQLGWFSYAGLTFLGWRGPNGIYFLYCVGEWFFWDGDSWVPTDFLT